MPWALISVTFENGKQIKIDCYFLIAKVPYYYYYQYELCFIMVCSSFSDGDYSSLKGEKSSGPILEFVSSVLALFAEWDYQSKRALVLSDNHGWQKTVNRV